MVNKNTNISEFLSQKTQEELDEIMKSAQEDLKKMKKWEFKYVLEIYPELESKKTMFIEDSIMLISDKSETYLLKKCLKLLNSWYNIKEIKETITRVK